MFTIRKSPAVKALLLVACLHLIGGHWLALQTVAWVGMFVDNQRTQTITEALENTFDGQHPCDLCVVVEKGQQDEGDQVPVLVFSQIVAVIAPLIELPTQAARPLLYFESAVTAPPTLRLSPLSPPPRYV